MLSALTILVLCQFAGEVVSRGIGLPVPGPVLGMLMLLAGLVVRERYSQRRPSDELKAAAQGLLGNLGLLFVPAGVGVITQLDVLARNWLAVLLAVPISTFLALFVTGWVMQRLISRQAEGQPET